MAIAVSNVWGHYFSAFGELKILIVKSLIGVFATLILSIILIPKMGIDGACWVNLAANIPEKTLEEMADYYRAHTTQLLIDYDDFDKYFEIVDISLSDTDNLTNNKNSFVGKVIEETTTHMIGLNSIK